MIITLNKDGNNSEEEKRIINTILQIMTSLKAKRTRKKRDNE